MSEKQKKRGLLAIFAVILFDITSFGMILPLVPILSREFGAGGLEVGLLIGSYSAIQFLLAPFWGRLSDILGRKPIILLGLFGSSLANLLFAFSGNFTNIFLSHVLAGFFGGNKLVAKAYIADLTSVKNRSKNIALVGLAFGVGFTLGPLLGFLFILIGENLGTAPPFSANFTAMGASLFYLINFVMSFFFLKESLTSRKKLSESFKDKNSSLFTPPSIYIVWKSLKTPKLGLVLITSFIVWLSLAQIEPVLILFIQDDFLWSKNTAYGSFIYIGILMVFSQGYLVRKWIPKWGEAFTNRCGLMTMSLGLITIALSGLLLSPSPSFFSPAFFALFFGVTFFSIGYSLSNTCLNGALSLMTSNQQQGSIFGVNQSLSAIARILGPVAGGLFYQQLCHESPFFIAGIFTLGALFIAFYLGKHFPNAGKLNQNSNKNKPQLEEMYSLNRYQLKNLLDKNIHFGFFQLEDFSFSADKKTEDLLKKAQRKTEQELLSDLKTEDFKQPLVLICEKGLFSQKLSQKLREKGFLNVYFIEGGMRQLVKDEGLE